MSKTTFFSGLLILAFFQTVSAQTPPSLQPLNVQCTYSDSLGNSTSTPLQTLAPSVSAKGTVETAFLSNSEVETHVLISKLRGFNYEINFSLQIDSNNDGSIDEKDVIVQSNSELNKSKGFIFSPTIELNDKEYHVICEW